MNAPPPREGGHEPRLRALLGATGQAHFRVSADWQEIRHLSGGGPVEDAEGTVEEWIGHCLPPADAEAFRAAVAAALCERRPLDLEHRVLRAGGGTGWARTRAVPVIGRDGAVEEWLGGAEDVTGRREAEAGSRLREERLALALDVAGLSTWDWDLATGEVAWSEGHFRLQGYTPGEVAPSYEAWASRVHPEDLPECEARLRAAIEGAGLYEADFRVLPGNGALRWCRARGQVHRDAEGRPARFIGIMQDVTALREAEERQRALLAELQHRVRNNMAAVRSILRRSARTAATAEDFAARMEGRLAAIGRVQSAVTRLVGAGHDLEALLRDELRAALAEEERLRIAGPAVRLPTRAAELMALAFHELASNAIEHGALGRPEGRIEASWELEGGSARLLRFRWTERAGEPLPPPRREGFGTELIAQILPYDLGARTRLEVGGDGVVCEVGLPLPA